MVPGTDRRFPKAFAKHCYKLDLYYYILPSSTAVQGMRGALVHPTMTTAHSTLMKLLTFLFWYCLLSVNADFNQTLDDTDPLIIYNPPSSWKETPFDPLDFDGTHMMTEDPIATATFTFTGTAIYYMSPRWPFRVNTLITLDDLPPELVSLRDRSQPEVEDGPETTQSQVVWSSVGLDNIEHTLVISVGNGENFAIVDGLLYTTLDGTEPTSSTGTTTSTDTSTDTSTQPILLPTSSSSSTSILSTATAISAASSSSKPAGLSTAIGIVCALFGLLALGALLWWWRRRRRRQREREREEYMSDLPVPPEMAETGARPMWRTRSARYRDIAAHIGASAPLPTAPVPPGRRISGSGRRAPPPPPHRKPPPVLKKPLTTIPEVSSRLASGTVLTARDVEGSEDGDGDGDTPFAPGHPPPWAEVRLVTPSGSGNAAWSGTQDTRRKEDPWTIREQ